MSREIEPELFGHTLDTLNGAVDRVFGSLKYGDDDFDFANNLKYNNALFSAFKTHKQQNELHDQMLDTDGNVRSFAEFRKAATPIIGNYNSTWLKTEYDTEIIRAQFARDWQQAERNSDIAPNGQWLPSTSVNKRETHQSFYHLIWPLDDSFWDTHHPGGLWGCKCGMRVTSEAPSDGGVRRSAAAAAPKPQKGLASNPGKTAEIFDLKNHPYVTECVGGAKAKKTVELECQKMISERSRNSVRAHFKEFFKGSEKVYNIDNGVVKKLSISFQDIKNITGKPHKFNYFKNHACYFLPEIMKTAKFVGSSPEIKFNKPGHNTVVKWHYYSFNLNDEISYLTVQENGSRIYRIHSIQDNDHFKLNKIKEKP